MNHEVNLEMYCNIDMFLSPEMGDLIERNGIFVGPCATPIVVKQLLSEVQRLSFVKAERLPAGNVVPQDLEICTHPYHSHWVMTFARMLMNLTEEYFLRQRDLMITADPNCTTVSRFAEGCDGIGPHYHGPKGNRFIIITVFLDDHGVFCTHPYNGCDNQIKLSPGYIVVLAACGYPGWEKTLQHSYTRFKKTSFTIGIPLFY